MKQKNLYNNPPAKENAARSLLLCALLLCCALPLSAQVLSKSDSAGLDSYLRQAIRRLSISGAAVVVVQGDELLLSSVYGGGGKLQPGAQFPLGSSTQSITALAAAELLREKNISPDEPAEKPLGEAIAPGDPRSAKITIRHLLNHTSGLSHRGLRHEPGSRYLYYAGNYRLLGSLIGRISGVSAEEYIARKIFVPLEMNSTSFAAKGGSPIAGYGSFLGVPYERKTDFAPDAAASENLAMSADDAGAFVRVMLRGLRGDETPFDTGVMELVTTPPQGIVPGYAMGWIKAKRGEREVYLHSGSRENFLSVFYLDPQRDRAFALMVNQGGVMPMLTGFAALRDTLIAFCDNGTIGAEFSRGPHLFMLALCIFVIVMEVYRFFRLRSWRAACRMARPVDRWLSLWIDALPAIFIAFGFMPALRATASQGIDWVRFYYMVPEVFVLLWFMAATGAVRSLLKVRRIIRGDF